METDQLGKLKFKQLTSADIPSIEEFCLQCEQLGYKNNSSLHAMKFHSATFFGAFDTNKLVSLAGVHHLPEVHNNAWRCLFRGAQLPGYTPTWSMDIFKSGIHFGYFLYFQIQHVLKNSPDAEFFISTNVDNPDAGDSSRLNKNMMPRLVKKGYCSLYEENLTLYSTQQNLWKINIENYLNARAQRIA